jgi:hypothetical protein
MSTKTRTAKKQVTRKANAKAAESGVSAAQRVFAKVLDKADPKKDSQDRKGLRISCF